MLVGREITTLLYGTVDAKGEGLQSGRAHVSSLPQPGLTDHAGLG